MTFGGVLEHFAAEYGWTPTYVLDSMTRAQVKLIWDKMQERWKAIAESRREAAEQADMVGVEEMGIGRG